MRTPSEPPVRAIELKEQGEKDHGQGHGQNGKENLGMAHAEEAEKQGDEKGKEQGGRDDYFQGVPFREVAGDHGHGVGPGGKVSPVSEGKQAGVSQKEIEAQAHDSKGQAVFKQHEVMQGNPLRHQEQEDEEDGVDRPSGFFCPCFSSLLSAAHQPFGLDDQDDAGD